MMKKIFGDADRRHPFSIPLHISYQMTGENRLQCQVSLQPQGEQKGKIQGRQPLQQSEQNNQTGQKNSACQLPFLIIFLYIL